MPTFPPIMPFVLLALLMIPIKFSPKQLAILAFAIWLMGGIVLTLLGITRLNQAVALPPFMLGLGLACAVLVGLAKGRFVLGKTANRNIDRLSQMTDSMRAFHVYGSRSWIVISLMVLLSVGLNLGTVPLYWRGLVNLAIGIALMFSSLNYLTNPLIKQLRSTTPPSA